jgi:tetratricopeptide (TPR) repeat protein
MSAGWRHSAGLLTMLGVGLVLAQADEPWSAARQHEILDTALRTYERAVQTERANPGRAAELFQHAAEGFLALRAGGVRNAALEYDLGTTYRHLGQPGRAIVHYRRAERLAPRAWRVSATLEELREHVEPRIVPAEAGVLATAGSWLERTSPVCRLAGLLIGAGLGWTALLAWLRWPRRGLQLAGVAGVLVGAVAGVSLHAQLSGDARHPPAVVVGEAACLHTRREPQTSSANGPLLGPGVELRILQQRGGWLEVRLGSGQTGWLLATAVERI